MAVNKKYVFIGKAKPVHQLLTKNHDRIIMDDNSEYQKHLQESYPCGPQTFLTAVEEVKEPQRTGQSLRNASIIYLKRSVRFHTATVTEKSNVCAHTGQKTLGDYLNAMRICVFQLLEVKI